MNLKSLLFASLTTFVAAPALADDQQPRAPQQQDGKSAHDPGQHDMPRQPSSQPKAPAQSAQHSTPSSEGTTLDTSKAMEISQQAMTHIAAAQLALDQGKKAAAKSALAKSKQALGKIYKTPPVTALLNEFDEAVNALSGKRPALEPLDLAPLAARVTTYRAYLDPEVSAGVDEAQRRQSAGDRDGAADALQLARNRVAIDLALLPVEEAYVRVLAAQQALQAGEMKSAQRMLREVPIIVGQVQVSQPLIPIRHKLQAAAEAAEANELERSRTLLREVTQEVKQLETAATDQEARSDITAIRDSLDRMSRASATPRADQIRELAKRTRAIGVSDQG